MARNSTVPLDVSVAKEACPLGLAPTASTTAALVMGDALAVALLESRGFSADDFARSHPGGRLGRRLLVRVCDIMHRDDEIPQVSIVASLEDALLEMTRKGLGMTAVLDEQQRIVGIYTDGDLRRTLDAKINLHTAFIKDVMTPGGIHIDKQMLAVDALGRMEQKKISGLFVIDDNDKLIGVLNMHDLLRAGVV